MDPALTFDKHINQIIGRVADKIKQLRRMRSFLNTTAATLVYKNMVLPILEYGDIFLTAATKENRDKMQTLQNKALRIALQVDKYCDTDLLHAEANLSRLKGRRQHLLLHMFTLREDRSVRKIKQGRGVKTRSSNKINFVLRKPNTEKLKKSATYIGPKIWNALSAPTQKADGRMSFKSALLALKKNTKLNGGVNNDGGLN